MTLLIVATLTFLNAHGQKNKGAGKNKCKVVRDTDTNMDFYIDLTSAPEPVDSTFDFWKFMYSNFKLPDKNYADSQKIKIIWILNKEGKHEFFKVAFPANDKELETEARRIISLLPAYKPAKCGQEPVASKNDFEFSVGHWKEHK